MSKERSHAPEPHSGGAGHAEQHARPKAETGGYWRVRVWLPAHPEPPAFDVVVRGKNAGEAETQACAQGGILSVDRSVNQVEITPASELDFIKAQAKRLGVDLRSKDCRKIKEVDDTDIAEDNPDRGKLTWSPPGHKLEKTYYVTDYGEVVDKKPEKEK